MAVWRSWSARLPVTQEVAGSSPATVANGPLVKLDKTPASQAGGVGSSPAGVTNTAAYSNGKRAVLKTVRRETVCGFESYRCRQYAQMVKW